MGILITLFFQPTYNLFSFLFFVIKDVGLAVLVTVLIVKIIFLPLSIKNTKTQEKLKKAEPKIAQIKKDFAKDKEKQARELLSVYKEEKINPLITLLFLFTHIPFIIGMFFIFKEKTLSNINTELLYQFNNFVHVTAEQTFFFLEETILMLILFAIIASVTQFIAVKISLKTTPQNNPLMEKFTKAMFVFLPILMLWLSFSLGVAFAVYIITINLFQIIQDLLILKPQSKHP